MLTIPSLISLHGLFPFLLLDGHFVHILPNKLS